MVQSAIAIVADGRPGYRPWGQLMREIGPERRRTPAYSLSQVLHASDDILELLPVAVCICDLDGRIVQFNSRAVQIWGRTPKPGEKHEHFTAEAKFYTAEGERLPESRVSKVLKSGQAVRNEEVVIDRADGTRIAILIDVDPLVDARGQMVGLVTCFQDVTERKRVHEALEKSRQELREQEERWNATYEHAAIGIVEIDADGSFLRVNESICDITGLTREELLGWKLFARTHPDDRDVDEDLYRRQVKGEIGFYSIEKRFVRKDGRVIWCAIRSSTVRDAGGHFLYGVRVVQDITARKEAEGRQKLLMDELNHRVKNTLATVQSLAAQTARGTDSPEAFRQSFEGRLIALSHAHDQLTRRHWASADLRAIVTAAVAPYLSGGQERVAISGDDVTVMPRVALTLAMVMHELTTNAVKYGSLSVPAGRVEVNWRIAQAPSQPPLLWIEWRESGGPPVAEPTRRGFGSRFIVGSVGSELQGTARLHFDPAGLRCTMEVPHEVTVSIMDSEDGV
jgi:PAS domain S-box-containing protein